MKRILRQLLVRIFRTDIARRVVAAVSADDHEIAVAPLRRGGIERA